jgi:3-hydroxyacyl-[acyl-carrier-protein] dehydratase
MTEIRTDNKKTIGFSEIKEKYLPHRYPIVMLDRITDYKAGEYVEAIKCVTGNSPELAGHFPDRAIMPATYIVQALAQLAIVFLKLSQGALREDEMTVVTTTKSSSSVRSFPGTRSSSSSRPSAWRIRSGFLTGAPRWMAKTWCVEA